jgi:hypothetical protein
VDKFLGRLTFGFLLSQVAPGFVMVTAIWLIYGPDLGVFMPAPAADGTQTPPWFFLLVLGALSGVVLDQLNWAAGGWHATMAKTEKFKLHQLDKLPSVVLILLGPIGAVFAVMGALFFSKVGDLTVEEFLPSIDPKRFEQWEWLQSFYVYSALFCANAALAAAILFVPVLMSDLTRPWATAVWFAAGILTLLENRAFGSLSDAERAFVDAGSVPKTAE